jgi:hypothetical protein
MLIRHGHVIALAGDRLALQYFSHSRAVIDL